MVMLPLLKGEFQSLAIYLLTFSKYNYIVRGEARLMKRGNGDDQVQPL